MAELKNDYVRAVDVAEILKALSHPVRLMIVATLCDGDANVSDQAEKLGLDQAVISQQLRILRMTGLVEFRRENGFSTYSIKEPRLKDLIRCLESCRSGGL